MGARHRHLDDRPDHAGGPGHAGQGARAVCQGQAPRPRRSDRAPGCRGLRLSRPRARRGGGSQRHRHPRGQRRHRIPQRPHQPGRQAGRHQVRDRGRRRRGRHGDRPRRLPGRGLPAGLRRDRRGSAGLRMPPRPGQPRRHRRPGHQSAPQGDPRDRRTGHAGQRAPRVLAGHAGRRRFHQDLDRQGRPGRDAPGDPGHARGGPRLPRGARPPGRRQGGRRHPHRQGRHPVSGPGQRDRGGGLAGPALVPTGCLRPAQRPAHAADQARHRPLFRSGLLHAGFTCPATPAGAQVRAG
jgi:hypothetical protein